MPIVPYAYCFTFSNVTGLDLSMLESVIEDLELSGNSAQRLAVPQLGFVGGDLDRFNNVELTDMDLDSLAGNGGSLTIVSNAILDTIDVLSLLGSVHDAITLIGAFERYE